MVKTIKQFFRDYIKPSQDSPDKLSDNSLQIATAALLIEMMRADGKVNEDERKLIEQTIRTKFKLSEEESDALLQLAEEKIWKATGYYEFTSLINKECTYDQKVKIIEHLWEVAFSDTELDKYEEHMIRRIADLIYVSHEDFIKAKLKVRKKKHSI